LTVAFKCGRSHRWVPMAERKGSRTLHIVFGKAFLLALERGNRASALVFARAFLSQIPRETERVTPALATA